MLVLLHVGLELGDLSPSAQQWSEAIWAFEGIDLIEKYTALRNRQTPLLHCLLLLHSRTVLSHGIVFIDTFPINLLCFFLIILNELLPVSGRIFIFIIVFSLLHGELSFLLLNSSLKVLLIMNLNVIHVFNFIVFFFSDKDIPNQIIFVAQRWLGWFSYYIDKCFTIWGLLVACHGALAKYISKGDNVHTGWRFLHSSMRSHLQSVIAARFRFMKAVDKQNIAEVWKFLEALGHSDSLLWCNLIRWLDSRDLLAVLIFVFLMIYVFDLVQLKGCVGPKFAVLFNIRFSFWRYSAKQWLPTVCQNHLRSKLIFQRAFLVVLI